MACYPGDAAEPICYPVIPLAPLNDPDYQYANPFTSPNFPSSMNPNQYLVPARVIDIAAADGSEFILPHFRLNEFLKGERGRFGFFSTSIARTIEDLRVLLGKPLIINSAYRSPKRNSAIGGATWSRHVYGDSIDFKVPGLALTTLRDACLKLGVSFYQIYQTHVHCDWRRKPLDPAFFDVSGLEPPANEDTLAEFNEYYSQRLKVEIVRRGGRAIFRAERPFQEDPEELALEWTIVLPDGSVHRSTASEPMLPYARGRYQVDVTIGGSVTIRGRELHAL